MTEYLIIIDTKCILNKTTEIINMLQINDLISYVYAIVFSLNTYILLIIITSRHIIHGCSKWSVQYTMFIYTSIVMIIYWILSMMYTIYVLNLSANIKLSIDLKNVSQCIYNQTNLISFGFNSIVLLLVVLFISGIGTI